MYGNFIEETCTGTAATLTLTGATTGNLAFSTQFADGDRLFYALEDSGGSIKIAGYGTWNTGGTITRNDIWNYNGTVVDKQPATNITLSAGTHTIRCCPIAESVLPSRTGYDNARSDSQYIVDPFLKGTSGSRGMAANWVYYNQFVLLGPVTLSGMGINVTALATTGSNLRLGLYEIDYSDNSMTLIDQTGDIDVSSGTGTTGYRTSNFSGGNLELDPKPYIIAVGGDSDCTVQGWNHSVGGYPYMPLRYELPCVGMFNTTGYSAGLPATQAGLDHNSTQTNGVYPLGFGVKA